MTAARGGRATTERDAGIAGWRNRVERLLRVVAGDERVRRLRAILDRNERAGGPLLSAGLAFYALFALLPALLLLAGLAGWLIDDPKTRAALVGDLVRRLPPLARPVEDTLDRLVSDRGTFSIIGLIGLAWGASNFYSALDEAMALLFSGGRLRNVIERRLRGFVGVAVLIGAALASVVLGAVSSYVEAAVRPDSEVLAWRLAGPALTALVMVIAVLIVYRVVPTAPPSWRAAFVPAVVAGLGVAVLTNLFTFVAPRLVGGLEAFGVLAALFGTLIWLNYGFQMLLLGAAWAALRRDEPVPVSPPSDPGEIG